MPNVGVYVRAIAQAEPVQYNTESSLRNALIAWRGQCRHVSFVATDASCTAEVHPPSGTFASNLFQVDGCESRPREKYDFDRCNHPGREICRYHHRRQFGTSWELNTKEATDILRYQVCIVGRDMDEIRNLNASVHGGTRQDRWKLPQLVCQQEFAAQCEHPRDYHESELNRQARMAAWVRTVLVDAALRGESLSEVFEPQAERVYRQVLQVEAEKPVRGGPVAVSARQAQQVKPLSPAVQLVRTTRSSHPASLPTPVVCSGGHQQLAAMIEESLQRVLEKKAEQQTANNAFPVMDQVRSHVSVQTWPTEEALQVSLLNLQLEESRNRGCLEDLAQLRCQEIIEGKPRRKARGNRANARL